LKFSGSLISSFTTIECLTEGSFALATSSNYSFRGIILPCIEAIRVRTFCVCYYDSCSDLTDLLRIFI